MRNLLRRFGRNELFNINKVKQNVFIIPVLQKSKKYDILYLIMS